MRILSHTITDNTTPTSSRASSVVTCDAAAEELQRYSLQDIEMRLLRKRFRLVNTTKDLEEGYVQLAW